ncbi:MAG: helix-turn-helix domain-containing protein [Acidimicrobiales bacterium]
MVGKLSLRQRNRVLAMRLVQETAVAMFETDGYDTTTVEAIAESSGVSASTIYRHFGTKERLVLWDERDPVVDAQLSKRLGQQPAVEAFRDAASVALADRDDIGLFLRRLQLIYAEPAIWGAAAQQDQIDSAELAKAFALADRRRKVRISDEVMAAVCLAALDVALNDWQKSGGKSSLSAVIEQAIDSALSLG